MARWRAPPDSSCPVLCRASTSFAHRTKSVDGGDKPGHDVPHVRHRMTPFDFVLIACTIISTSFISGLFGMAGGMILVGVLLVYFDVATGMVIFSIIQFVANGWRAVLWARFVIWRIFFVYAAAAIISFAIMRYVAIIPSKAMVYLGLGALPFAIELLPKDWRPNIEWRGVPFITGVLTTVIQLLTRVGGLFLDIFFPKSMLDRKTTIATKAVTQTFSHVVRAVYFGSFVGVADAVPLWTYVPAIVLSIAGTTLAAQVLERMTDTGFRQWTRRVIFAVCAVYLARGVMLLAGY